MPFRPAPAHRRNVHGVIYPLTEAIRLLYGARSSDGAYPIGLFYTVNIDSQVWSHAGGIWYRPRNVATLEQRQQPSDHTVQLFMESISTGSDVQLVSGTVVRWERIPDREAAQLPARRTRL